MVCFLRRSPRLSRSLCLPLALLSLLPGLPACAVDIVLNRGFDIIATGPSHPPGICCEVPPLRRMRPTLPEYALTEQISATAVTFRGMLAGDFGAV